MSEEYDLKKSEQTVGQLQAVIKDAHGRIVDGLHRKEANPKWKEEIRSDVKTEEDYWKARAHLNFSRRNATEARQEKLDIVNKLAEFYQKQGLKVSKSLEVTDVKPQVHGGVREGASGKNEILDAVIKALDGAIPDDWIRQNIDSRYVQGQRPKEQYREGKATTTTLKQLEQSKFIKKRYGEDFGDRIRKEVKEEAKQELLKSPEFIVEAIASSPEITKIVEAPIPEVKMSKEELAKVAENIEQVHKDLQERKHDPKHVERGELVKNWMAHTRVTGVAESLHCPVCGNDASHLIWECHNLSIREAHKLTKERLES